MVIRLVWEHLAGVHELDRPLGLRGAGFDRPAEWPTSGPTTPTCEEPP